MINIKNTSCFNVLKDYIISVYYIKSYESKYLLYEILLDNLILELIYIRFLRNHEF